MTNLRNFLTELGFENVRSVLQSGNLVFGSRSRFGAELERYLEMEASKRLALESDFYVRTAEEWKGVIRQNPFRKEAERDPKTSRRPVSEERPASERRHRFAGGYHGSGNRQSQGKTGLHLLSGRNRPVQAHERDDRKENRSWDGAELEYGFETRRDCEKAGSLRLTPAAPAPE